MPWSFLIMPIFEMFIHFLSISSVCARKNDKKPQKWSLHARANTQNGCKPFNFNRRMASIIASITCFRFAFGAQNVDHFVEMSFNLFDESNIYLILFQFRDGCYWMSVSSKARIEYHCAFWQCLILSKPIQ